MYYIVAYEINETLCSDEETKAAQIGQLRSKICREYPSRGYITRGEGKTVPVR